MATTGITGGLLRPMHEGKLQGFFFDLGAPRYGPGSLNGKGI